MLIGYSIYLSVTAHRLRKKHFVSQVRLFIDMMKKLDIPEHDILDLLSKYDSFDELRKANKKLLKGIKDYRL